MTAGGGEVFTDQEIEYLTSQPLGRLATVTPQGTPHVVPIGLHLAEDHRSFEIGAYDLPDKGQQRGYRRNIEHNPNVALIVDDLGSTDPWLPRAVYIKGRA